MQYESYIPLIVKELKKAKPEKIILFGSNVFKEVNELLENTK